METTINSTGQDHTFMTTNQQIDAILTKKEKIKGLQIERFINEKIQEWIEKSLAYNDKKSDKQDMFYEGCSSVVDLTIATVEEIKQYITEAYKK